MCVILHSVRLAMSTSLGIFLRKSTLLYYLLIFGTWFLVLTQVSADDGTQENESVNPWLAAKDRLIDYSITTAAKVTQIK